MSEDPRESNDGRERPRERVGSLRVRVAIVLAACVFSCAACNSPPPTEEQNVASNVRGHVEPSDAESRLDRRHGR